jgi:hypothetical protein
MERQGEETHLDTEEARGAESTGVMRWVLGISLLLAIGLLSAIWIFGAWTQDDVESQATVSGTATETGSSDTDSIVSQDADEIRGVDKQDLPPGRIEN